MRNKESTQRLFIVVFATITIGFLLVMVHVLFRRSSPSFTKSPNARMANGESPSFEACFKDLIQEESEEPENATRANNTSDTGNRPVALFQKKQNFSVHIHNLPDEYFSPPSLQVTRTAIVKLKMRKAADAKTDAPKQKISNKTSEKPAERVVDK